MKIKRDNLDVLFSELIRRKSKGLCARCGKWYGWKKLQTCHCFSRRHKGTRWDEENACACDFGCHQYLDSEPIEKIEFFKKRIGETNFDLLQGRAYQITKPDRQGVELYLRQMLQELEEEE